MSDSESSSKTTDSLSIRSHASVLPVSSSSIKGGVRGADDIVALVLFRGLVKPIKVDNFVHKAFLCSCREGVGRSDAAICLEDVRIDR